MAWGKSAAALVVVAVAIVGLNHLGWCWSSFRFVGKNEIIAAAIDEVATEKRLSVTTHAPEKLTIKPYDVVPYESAERFRATNPQCCEISPASGDDTTYFPPIQRWLGLAPYNVRVNYTARYIGDGGQTVAAKRTRNIIVTRCGKIYNP